MNSLNQPPASGSNPTDNPFVTKSASGSSQPAAAEAPPWRYGLFSLMLAMLVFSVIGVAASQLMRAVRQGTSPKVVFVMFTLTAPIMLVTLISLARGIAVWVRGQAKSIDQRRR